MCKQTETMHVDKQLKPEQLKEPMAMYDCGQHVIVVTWPWGFA